jgi:hypothetical protein
MFDMSDIDYFRLMHGGKISYFDCHRRWLPKIITSDKSRTHSRRTLLSQRDR